MGGKPRLTAAEIERFRQTGIRIDRSGRMWHRSVEITHPRLIRAILCWLDRLPDGRPIVRLDATRYAYVEVEDSDLIAVSTRWSENRALLRLNDGAEEELDYSSLCVGADNALYCRVRGGALSARLSSPAYYALVERAVETENGFALKARGQLHPIAAR